MFTASAKTDIANQNQAESMDEVVPTSPDCESLAHSLDLTTDAAIALDAGRRIASFNRAAELMFGYAAGEVLGRPLDLLIPKRFRTRHDDALEVFRRFHGAPRMMADRRPVFGLRRDGSEFPAEASIAWIEQHDSGGLFAVVLRDITERRQAEQSLARLGRIIEQASEDIYLFDAETGRYIQVNRGACDNLGYLQAAVTNLTVLDILPAFTRERLNELLRPLVEGRDEQVTVRTFTQRRNGSTYEVDLRFQYLPSESPPLILAIGRDVSERNQFEAIIQRQTLYDLVTMLPNRRTFIERLGQTLTMARRNDLGVGVLMVGIENVRLVGDSLGLPAADELIQLVATRLMHAVRGRDMVARLGDQEFGVVASPIGTIQDVVLLAERLLAELKTPFTVGGYQIVVPAAIGIATFPENGCTPDVLLRNADAAMVSTRETGPINYRFFTPGINQLVRTRMAIGSGLTRALERNEFELVYQPKIDIASWRISGVEALLRWRNAELGNIPPGTFVPVLEQTGMIVPVGEWVLGTACRQCRTLRERGFPHIRMAVNLSVRQIDTALFDAVTRLIASAGVTAADIELEITESVIMREGHAGIEVLRRLAERGIQLSIDDFGCGYSSLSYLRLLPLSTIKIDRSFITDLAGNADAAAIVHAIVAMGQALRRRVVAEGVETMQQLALLRDMGCHEIQGFLFSPPVTGDELMRLLEATDAVLPPPDRTLG